MSTRVAIAQPTLVAADERATTYRLALWVLLAAKLVGGLGVQWDIRWHLLIGRDSFWIAPHVMTYTGVTLAGLLTFGVLLLDTLRVPGEPRPGTVRIAGLVGTRGFHLAWWGVVVTVAAAPIDDLWHRLFGIDVTLWSPPHVLGMVGGQLNTLGCLLIAREVWPPRSRARRVAVLTGATLLLGSFAVWVDPSVLTAYRHGGPFFFTWAVLGALAFGFSCLLAARLSGLRSAPLILVAGIVGLHGIGLAVSDVGFALTKPVPALEAAIAADPDSPIALTHEMARRNGTVPGRALLLRLLPVLGAVLMVLADPRRRWRTASLAFGLGLLVASGVQFARLPALSHALPGFGDVLLAVLGTGLAALGGGAAAVRVAAWLSPTTSPGETGVKPQSTSL